MIPQASASERYEAARKALATYEQRHGGPGPGYRLGHRDSDHPAESWDARDSIEMLATALRALIAPPSVGESEHDAAMRIAEAYYPEVRGTAYEAAARGIRAGIQSAHETWEPADRPSQEMMLRWLGIRYTESAEFGYVYIPLQTIEKEAV